MNAALKKVLKVMQFRYGLDDRPPLRDWLLFGLQWFAVAVPSVIIIGRVVGHLQFPDGLGQTVYLQKTCFLTAVTLIVQVLAGHRLPLIAGPSTVLLIGVVGVAAAFFLEHVVFRRPSPA